MMVKENEGGFKNKAVKCTQCKRTFRIEHLDAETTDEDVEHCPYCGENPFSTKLSDDEILEQIKKSGGFDDT